MMMQTRSFGGADGEVFLDSLIPIAHPGPQKFHSRREPKGLHHQPSKRLVVRSYRNGMMIRPSGANYRGANL
jgi:hypothetical protein